MATRKKSRLPAPVPKVLGATKIRPARLRMLTGGAEPLPKITAADSIKVARARAKEIREERLREFAKLAKTYKPKATERGKILYLAESKRGKPRLVKVSRNERRKSFAVLVTEKGKIEPNIEPKRDWLAIHKERALKRGRAEHGRKYKLTAEEEKKAKIHAEIDKVLADVPKKLYPKFHDTLAGRFSKVAREQIRVKTKAVRTRITKEGDKEVIFSERQRAGRRAMTWDAAVVEPAIEELSKSWAMLRGQEKDLVVRAMVTVEGKDGQETFEIAQKFQARFYQDFDREVFEDYARRKLYADFAHQLRMRDLVSSGSAESVRRRGYNSGLDRSEWAQNAQGERWEKNEFEAVKIVQSKLWVEKMI